MIDLKDKSIKFFIKVFANSIRWDSHKYFECEDIQNSPDLKLALFTECVLNNKSLGLELLENFSSREIDSILKQNNVYEKVRKYTINQLVTSVKKKGSL